MTAAGRPNRTRRRVREPPLDHARLVRRGAERLRGAGLTGVRNFSSSALVLPRLASCRIWVRTSCCSESDAAPNAVTASSIVDQRSDGSFSSIRITASASSGGQSGIVSAIGGIGVWQCSYIMVRGDLSLNGGLPVIISYATIPSEY